MKLSLTSLRTNLATTKSVQDGRPVCEPEGRGEGAGDSDGGCGSQHHRGLHGLRPRLSKPRRARAKNEEFVTK